MKPELQRIKIAEACGWTFVNRVDKFPHGLPPEGRIHRYTIPLPDYLNDLNAMHEAEKVLNIDQKLQYVEMLRSIKGPVSRDRTPVTWIYAHLATAAQRAEAFLRTLNLWENP